eukprot:3363034-Pyramimonas_sp.AAC.1
MQQARTLWSAVAGHGERRSEAAVHAQSAQDFGETSGGQGCAMPPHGLPLAVMLSMPSLPPVPSTHPPPPHPSL